MATIAERIKFARNNSQGSAGTSRVAELLRPRFASAVESRLAEENRKKKEEKQRGLQADAERLRLEAEKAGSFMGMAKETGNILAGGVANLGKEIVGTTAAVGQDVLNLVQPWKKPDTSVSLFGKEFITPSGRGQKAGEYIKQGEYKKAAGEFGTAGLDIVSTFATPFKGLKFARGGLALKGVTEGATAAAPIMAAYGATGAAAEGASGKEILKQAAIGGATGLAAGGVLGGALGLLGAKISGRQHRIVPQKEIDETIQGVKAVTGKVTPEDEKALIEAMQGGATKEDILDATRQVNTEKKLAKPERLTVVTERIESETGKKLSIQEEAEVLKDLESGKTTDEIIDTYKPKTEADIIAKETDETKITSLIKGKVPEDKLPIVSKALTNTNDPETVARIMDEYNPETMSSKRNLDIAQSESESTISRFLKETVSEEDIPELSKILKNVEDPEEVGKILKPYTKEKSVLSAEKELSGILKEKTKPLKEINVEKLKERDFLKTKESLETELKATDEKLSKLEKVIDASKGARFDDASKKFNELSERKQSIEDTLKSLNKKGEEISQRELEKAGEVTTEDLFGKLGDEVSDNYTKFTNLFKDARLRNPKVKEALTKGDFSTFENELSKRGVMTKAETESLFYADGKTDDEVFDMFRDQLMKENPSLMVGNKVSKGLGMETKKTTTKKTTKQPEKNVTNEIPIDDTKPKESTIAQKPQKTTQETQKVEKSGDAFLDIKDKNTYTNEDWKLKRDEFLRKYPDVLEKGISEMNWIEAEKMFVQGKLLKSIEFQTALKEFREVDKKFTLGDREWRRAARKVDILDKEADREIGDLLVYAKKGDSNAINKLNEYSGILKTKSHSPKPQKLSPEAPKQEKKVSVPKEEKDVAERQAYNTFVKFADEDNKILSGEKRTYEVQHRIDQFADIDKLLETNPKAIEDLVLSGITTAETKHINPALALSRLSAHYKATDPMKLMEIQANSPIFEEATTAGQFISGFATMAEHDPLKIAKIVKTIRSGNKKLAEQSKKAIKAVKEEGTEAIRRAFKIEDAQSILDKLMCKI